MYCSSCGTQLSDDSRFCFKCGKEVSTQLGQSKIARTEIGEQEWEYFTYERMATKGQALDIVVGAEQHNEAAARLSFWYKHQAEIMEALAHILEDEWEPLNEIGPGSLLVTTSAEHSKGCLQTLFNISAIGFNWWWIGVRVKFRRIKGKGKFPPPTSQITIDVRKVVEDVKSKEGRVICPNCGHANSKHRLSCKKCRLKLESA